MNVRYVISRLGLLFVVLSALMLFMTAAVFFLPEALMRHEVDPEARLALMLSAGIGAVAGGLMWILNRRAARILGRREALLLVALSWIVGAALSALPYYLWASLDDMSDVGHPFAGFISCYFEAMSGLTTTGATVLADIEALPRSLLFWRATTHWVGGLGIVVLFVAILPSLGVGGKKLFKVEAPGPRKRGIQPRIAEAARVIGLIYLGLTLGVFMALWLFTPMNWLDAICHAFATMATGGFSTRNASIAAYDSLSADIIIMIFMLLAGVNFGLYFHLLRGQAGLVWRDTELRVYLATIAIASLVVVGTLLEQRIVSSAGAEVEPSAAAAVRHGVFQVVSIQTTTGFVTADFDRWGFFPKTALVILMFIGGSAGSTAGGIKVIRIWMTLRIMLAEIERIFRPQAVRPLRVGGTTIDDMLKLATVSYVLGILVLCLIGALLLMFLEPAGTIDFTTAATASAATLNNIGPGLARVGAIQNFGWFSDASKVVMTILMALGRLEVFAIIVLFSPRFWKGD